LKSLECRYNSKREFQETTQRDEKNNSRSKRSLVAGKKILKENTNSRGYRPESEKEAIIFLL